MIGESWFREDVAEGHIENLKVEHDAFFRARAFFPALLAVSRWGRKCYGNQSFTVVDIGCGGGAYAMPFSRYLYDNRYAGIDPSPAMIDQARAYHKDIPLRNATFYVGGFAKGLRMFRRARQALLFVCGSAEYTDAPMATMAACLDAVPPGKPFVFHKLRLDRHEHPTGWRFSEPTYAGQSDLFWLWSLPMVYDLLASYDDLQFDVIRWPSDPGGCITIGGRRNDL